MFLLSRFASRKPQVLASLIVFSLSAGVLGGVLFYFDSVGPDVLSEITENVPIDMYISFSSSFYGQNETSLDDILAIVNDQEEISSVERVALIEYSDWTAEDWIRGWGLYLGVSSTFFDSTPNAIRVLQDDVILTNGTCLIENTIFLEDNLEIGDNYTASVTRWVDPDGWMQVNATYEIVGTYETDIYSFGYYPDEPERTHLFMVTAIGGLLEGFQDIGYGGYSGIRDELWVTFDHSIVYEEDPITKLNNVENRIEQRSLPYARIDFFELVVAVYEFSAWSASMRAIAIAFSIPSIIMGIMTIQYMSGLMADERRRDVGTLKTRGSSGWQAFRWILSSALVTGFVGSVGALGMGIAGAFVSGGARELLVFDLSLLSEFQLLLTQNAMITVFAFSFIVGVGVALPPSIHALLITPTEAHSILERDVLVGAETMGSAGTDLIGFAISSFLLTPMLMSLRFMSYSYGGLAAFAIVLIPILSVFILTLARLMSRPTSRMKAKFMDIIGRGRLISSSKVLSRNIRLFKKSEAMGSIFIAMVFTAGVFSAISATTGNAHMRDVFMFMTGADIRVDADPLLDNVTLDLIDNITQIDGIRSVSGVLQIEGQITYTTNEFGMNFEYNDTIAIYGVQPTEWIDSAFWKDYFTLDDIPANSLARLAQNSNNILASFKPVLYYDVTPLGEYIPIFGNEVGLEIKGESWKNYTDCSIVDVLSSDEYLFSASTKYLPGQPAAQKFAVANLDFLHDCLNVTEVSSFYISLEENANHTQVALDIYNVAPHSFLEIDIAKAHIDDSLKSRAGQSIYGAYTLNVIFSIIYLSAGVMIVTIVRFSKLQRQFSVMRALGAETRYISLSVLGSAIAGLLIAAAIGILIGLVLTYFAIQLPLAYMGAQTASLWSRLPVVLVVPYLLIGGILGSAVAFTLGLTYAVASRGLRRNIAQEIQYTD